MNSNTCCSKRFELSINFSYQRFVFEDCILEIKFTFHSLKIVQKVRIV